MIKEQKKQLRCEIRELKKAYSTEQKQQKSAEIFNALEQLPQFQQAATILCYWAMDDEVQTQAFIHRQCGKKTIVLPVVCGDSLLLQEYTTIECMKESGCFTILEPDSSTPEIPHHKIDLAIVPGVAFDRQNNRLGRGKGYYDKLLNLLHAHKVGVCFDFQVVENVPTEAFDIKMDTVLFA